MNEWIYKIPVFDTVEEDFVIPGAFAHTFSTIVYNI